MKKTQRICLLSVFLLLLTTRTFAGQIDTPGFTTPPPPPPPSLVMDTSNGDSVEISISNVAYDLLQIMLSVF